MAKHRLFAAWQAKSEGTKRKSLCGKVTCYKAFFDVRIPLIGFGHISVLAFFIENHKKNRSYYIKNRLYYAKQIVKSEKTVIISLHQGITEKKMDFLAGRGNEN